MAFEALRETPVTGHSYPQRAVLPVFGSCELHTLWRALNYYNMIWVPGISAFSLCSGKEKVETKQKQPHPLSSALLTDLNHNLSSYCMSVSYQRYMNADYKIQNKSSRCKTIAVLIILAPISLFCFMFLKHDLVLPKLALESLGSWGWLWTSALPASIPQC